MTTKRTVAISVATAVVLAIGTSSAAMAGGKGRKHWGHGPYHVPPGHVRVYHPAPVYYAPAPVLIAPAPVYVAPAPIYAVPIRPVISFGAVIPLR